MMKMTTPDASVNIKLNMVGFVDDYTTMTSDDPTISAYELLKRIQHHALIWHGSLWVFGGNLELEKCGYYYIFL